MYSDDSFIRTRLFPVDISRLLNRPIARTWKSVPTLFVRISEISWLSEPRLTNHHCTLVWFRQNTIKQTSAYFAVLGCALSPTFFLCTFMHLLSEYGLLCSLLEVDHPDITDTVITQLSGIRKSLKKMTFKGAQILLQKLDSLSGEYKLWCVKLCHHQEISQKMTFKGAQILLQKSDSLSGDIHVKLCHHLESGNLSSKWHSVWRSC